MKLPAEFAGFTAAVSGDMDMESARTSPGEVEGSVMSRPYLRKAGLRSAHAPSTPPRPADSPGGGGSRSLRGGSGDRSAPYEGALTQSGAVGGKSPDQILAG